MATLKGTAPIFARKGYFFFLSHSEKCFSPLTEVYLCLKVTFQLTIRLISEAPLQQYRGAPGDLLCMHIYLGRNKMIA